MKPLCNKNICKNKKKKKKRIAICFIHRLYFLAGVIPKKGLAGLVPVIPAFFWYGSDKDLKSCFCRTRLS